MNRLRNVNPITAAIIVVIFIVFTLVMVYWNPGAPPPQKPVDFSTNTPEPFPASTTPAVKRPVLPEAAKQPTKAGGEAFHRYFIEVYNYTLATADTSLIKQIMREESPFRKKLIQDMEANPEADKDVRLTKKINKVSFLDGVTPEIDIEAEVILLRNGKLADQKKRTSLFIAGWIDGRWLALSEKSTIVRETSSSRS